MIHESLSANGLEQHSSKLPFKETEELIGSSTWPTLWVGMRLPFAFLP